MPTRRLASGGVFFVCNRPPTESVNTTTPAVRPGRVKQALSYVVRLCRLLQRGTDITKGGRQLAAHALDGGDDRDGNAGGDQAVFNGSRAALVFGKPQNKRLHCGSFICCPRRR